MSKNEQAEEIKALYPKVDWPRLEEINRAMNHELWWGPLPVGYWKDVDPLEHYEWRGFTEAVEDLLEIVDGIDREVYEDDDGFIILSNPEDHPGNWEGDNYVGGQYYTLDPLKVILAVEVYRNYV